MSEATKQNVEKIKHLLDDVENDANQLENSLRVTNNKNGTLKAENQDLSERLALFKDLLLGERLRRINEGVYGCGLLIAALIYVLYVQFGVLGG